MIFGGFWYSISRELLVVSAPPNLGAYGGPAGGEGKMMEIPHHQKTRSIS